MGAQTNNQNQKRVHTYFGMIYLKAPSLFFLEQCKNKQHEESTESNTTHSNQITLIQLIHATIPFKIKKKNTMTIFSEEMLNAIGLMHLFFYNWNLVFFGI